MDQNLSRTALLLPITLHTIISAMLDISTIKYPIFDDPWNLFTKGGSISNIAKPLLVTLLGYNQELAKVEETKFPVDPEALEREFLSLLTTNEEKVVTYENLNKVLSAHFAFGDLKSMATHRTKRGVTRLLIYIAACLYINIPKTHMILFRLYGIHKQFIQLTKTTTETSVPPQTTDKTYEHGPTGSDQTHRIDFDGYLTSLLQEWDFIHLPIVEYCVGLGIKGTLRRLVKSIRHQTRVTKYKYSKELQVWCHFTEKFDVSHAGAKHPKWTFRSPLRWIYSAYQVYEPFCTQYIEMARRTSSFYKTDLAKIKSLPLFDEIYALFAVVSKTKPDRLGSDLRLNYLARWYSRGKWFLTRVNAPIFGSLELPPLVGHVGFWSMFYCIQRLSLSSLKRRRRKSRLYETLFDVNVVKKDVIPRLEGFIEEVTQPLAGNVEFTKGLENILDDRLDYHVQAYLTCFVDMLDWFIDMMRIKKPIDDDHTPLLLLYPHPGRDLAFTNRFMLGHILQNVKLWHESTYSLSAIVLLLEKASEFKSHSRVMPKKINDCCEKNNAMTYLTKIICMRNMMGLYQNHMLAINVSGGTYTMLPHIYRPDFTVVYFTYRYFFDRRFGDAIYRHRIHKIIAGFNLSNFNSAFSDQLGGYSGETVTQGKTKAITISLQEEIKTRKITFDHRADALIPISNDLLMSYLEKEPKLSANMVKEFFMSVFVQEPQYWMQYPDSYGSAKYDQSYNTVENKWRDYFIKTVFWSNVYRYNLGIMIRFTYDQMRVQGVSRSLKPWEFDTIMSANIRKVPVINKVIKQFERFYGTRVYPFPKRTLPMMLYSQLEYFMEAMVRNGIILEQDFSDISTIIDFVIPKLRVLTVSSPNLKLVNYHAFLVKVLQRLLIQVGCKSIKAIDLPVTAPVNDQDISHFNTKLDGIVKACSIIVDAKRKVYDYYTSPLDAGLIDTIWGIFFNNKDPVTEQELHTIFDSMFTKKEVLVLFQLIKLQKEIQSPREIRRLVGLLPIHSFRKIHYLFKCICNSQNVKTVTIDHDSVCKIHETMLHTKFNMIPSVHTDPKHYMEMYRVYLTFCCNRIVSVSNGSMLYGHAYVSYDYINERNVCSKKKVKKMAKERSQTLADITSKNYRQPMVVPDKAEQGLQALASEALQDLLATRTTTRRKPGHVEYRAFTSVLESLNFHVLQKIPKKALETMEQQIQCELIDKDDEDGQYRIVLSNIDTKRFRYYTTKEQNKLIRLLGKATQPSCAQNPPMASINGFGKRFYYGREEKSKKIYQHCLNCGNFTSYHDENWSHDYKCFSCWLKWDLIMICRCTYCRVIAYNTLEKVQQKSNKKLEAHIVFAQGAQFFKPTHQPKENVEEKEKTKKIRDAIKSQKRQKVLHECLHTPMFPICTVTPNKKHREAAYREKFQFGDATIKAYNDKERAHKATFAGSVLTISKAYHGIPCYFSGYFCTLHQPLNPNVIKRSNQGQEALAKHRPKGLKPYARSGQTTNYVTGSNFNVNNIYRISMLDPFWQLLNNRYKTVHVNGVGYLLNNKR